MNTEKSAQSLIREFVKRERSNLIERRNAIIRETQEAFDKEILRLDEFESRLAKEDIAIPLPAPPESSPEEG